MFIYLQYMYVIKHNFHVHSNIIFSNFSYLTFNNTLTLLQVMETVMDYRYLMLKLLALQLVLCFHCSCTGHGILCISSKKVENAVAVSQTLFLFCMII